ncbi:TIGR01777 family oxidoreductase [Microbacterium sp.]|uniref:TIGR01777 family oxidoreductase n=1 Tax=Microbacterium sp. TaxID=51671 RepID=UPI0039E3808A
MPDAPARVVVAGASGLLGRALVDALTADGVPVTRLVRGAPAAPTPLVREVAWAPGVEPLDPAVVEGAAAAVCLNGATLGRFPWTSAYKRELLRSRLTPTHALATAVRRAGVPVLVGASAVGFYPARSGGALTERSPRGDSFLADLCARWEAAARSAGPATRVVHLRTAPVTHPGGVLGPLVLLTRLGLSGPIGRGTQSWPWIGLDDAVRAIRHTIDAGLEGPVNLAGPTRAVANDLGFALAQRLNRPFLLRAPAWAMRLVLGRDATDALLTSDMHVVPAVLEASGFTFAHRTVEDAVAAALPRA